MDSERYCVLGRDTLKPSTLRAVSAEHTASIFREDWGDSLVLRKDVNSSRLQGVRSKETYLLTCRETVKFFETDVVVFDYFKFRHKTRIGPLAKIVQQLNQVVLELKDSENHFSLAINFRCKSPTRRWIDSSSLPYSQSLNRPNLVPRVLKISPACMEHEY